MSTWLRSNVALAAAAVLFLVMMMTYVVSAAAGAPEDGTSGERAARDAAATELQRRTVERDAALLGADSGRLEQDRELIETLADRAMTWQDQASYTEARDSVQRRYRLAPGGSFMTTFLPPAPVNTDSSGNEYPYIDALGLNSSVLGTEALVTTVEGTRYDYVVLVFVESSSSDGETSAGATAVITLSSEGTGRLLNVKGSAMGSPVRRSN